MDPVIVFVLIFGSVFGAVLLWTKLRPDPVGYRTRLRRNRSGLQGQLDEWLYWQAPLTKPPMRRVVDAEPQPGESPWLRALQTLVRREMLEADVEPAEAFGRLQARAKTPLSRAFLQGKVSRAIRLHWSTRYDGPDVLYPLWFYGVALIRYGRRHLYLDTLSAALKELRNT